MSLRKKIYLLTLSNFVSDIISSQNTVPPLSANVSICLIPLPSLSANVNICLDPLRQHSATPPPFGHLHNL